MQKGFVPILILVGIVVLITIAGGAYYFGKSQSVKPVSQTPTTTPTSTPQPTPSSNTSNETANPDSIGANWKTYTHSNFTFKYPDNWYPENNPNYPGGDNVSFFLVGTKADHGYGDHKGNEVFSFELSKDERTLDELKNNYYPTATNLTIAGKPALKTPSNLYIVKPSGTETVNIVGGIEEGKKYIDQILSTFKFTQ